MATTTRIWLVALVALSLASFADAATYQFLPEYVRGADQSHVGRLVASVPLVAFLEKGLVVALAVSAATYANWSRSRFLEVVFLLAIIWSAAAATYGAATNIAYRLLFL
jgi:hypothetical protein